MKGLDVNITVYVQIHNQTVFGVAYDFEWENSINIVCLRVVWKYAGYEVYSIRYY